MIALNEPLSDQEIAELDEFLIRPNPAVIGTLRPDGSPHTAATWYIWDDDRVLVNMDAWKGLTDAQRKVLLSLMGTYVDWTGPGHAEVRMDEARPWYATGTHL